MEQRAYEHKFIYYLSLVFRVSSLAYPNLLGTKCYVIVVVVVSIISVARRLNMQYIAEKQDTEFNIPNKNCSA